MMDIHRLTLKPLKKIEDEIRYNLSSGWTVSHVRGVWTDDSGKVYNESIHRYTIAVPYGRLEDQLRINGALHKLARVVKELCKQEAVYLVYPSGDVEIYSGVSKDNSVAYA